MTSWQQTAHHQGSNQRSHAAMTDLTVRGRIGNRFLLEWTVPVRIRVGEGLPELIYGPAEAIDMLQNRWPARRGRHYGEALHDCTAAIERTASLSKARETFVAASVEADMLSR